MCAFVKLANAVQAAVALAVQKPVRLGACWPVALPHRLALPADCAAGDLLEVLEFVQVYLYTHV